MYLNKLSQKLFRNFDSTPDLLMGSYFPSMDGLRALAIINVIIRHIALKRSWAVWVDGSIGVHVFFIISGFLITTLLLKERVSKGTVSLRKFYIRRTLRIFPVAYLYIFTLIILSLIFHFTLSNKSIFTSIFYLKNFPSGSDWYTGHFWTLSVEEQFYLIAPVILITDVNRYIKLIILASIVVPVVDFIAFHNIGGFYSIHTIHVITAVFLTLLDQGTLYILLGSLFSILIFKKILVLEKFKNHYLLSTVCFIAAVIIHFPNSPIFIPYLSSTLFGILMAFVIVLNLYENNFLTSILSNPVLVRIGILSYSLYVWQQLFTSQQPWSGLFKYSDSIALNMLALVLVSTCSYYFYERKFLILKSKFK